MDLDTLLAAIRNALRMAERQGPDWRGRIEMRIDIEALDHIEWHLSNHRRTVGNTSRPPPRDTRENKAQQDRETAWEYQRKREQEKARARAEERAKNEYRWDGNSAFYEEFREYSRGDWEKIFDDAYKRSSHSYQYGKIDEKKKRPWTEVLGIRPTATKAEATKAYRRLCMRWHPDRPNGDHEKFVELQQAWKQSPHGR
jgi:hypothetical protein